jgi:hypothetical protein
MHGIGLRKLPIGAMNSPSEAESRQVYKVRRGMRR